MLPKSIHRRVLPVAYALRHRWRLLRKVQLQGVTIIARDLGGQVLLVRHSYGPQGWFLPGGGLHRGEEPKEAAARELREETDCDCEGLFLVGIMSEKVSGSPHNAHVFTCITHDMPVADGREIAEARFFPTHSLPEPLNERTRARLKFWQDPANSMRPGHALS